jgi:hypothetical protein
MKATGSIYVGATFAILVAYFSYQWWLNPSRALKRQMGEIAAALSVPANESDVARIARIAQLGRHLAADVRVHAGADDISSRDAVLGALSARKLAAAGVDVQFVDTQVFIDSDTVARAYMLVEIGTPDPRGGQPTIERQDASVRLEKRDGQWLITNVESKERPPLR